METDKNVLDTKIDSVIVYQQGVQITLSCSIDLKSGEQVLTLTDLPETLDKESIRVKGIGHGRIVNITVDYTSKKEYKKEEHEDLKKEKENIERELNRKKIELARLNEQVSRYKSTEDNFYGSWSKAYAFGEVGLSNFIEFNESLSERINSKSNAIEELTEIIKAQEVDLQVIRNKMSKLGPIEKIMNFYEITINLNVLKDSEFKFEIKYTMSQAWWQAHYDIALSESNARLTMMANVYNRTGSDWKDVLIEISTATLKPIRLVKPTPMILEERAHILYSRDTSGFIAGKADMLMEKKELFLKDTKKKKIKREEQKPQIEASYAEVSENIGVQSFKIPNRIDIPSDENPHPINLTQVEMESEKKYYWSSAAPEKVIIRDKLKNADLLLLAGNVKIYFEEEFLGETSIPVIAPKEEFKLGTRVSYALKVDKKLVDRSKAKKAIKGKFKNEYEYKITIKNLLEVSEELVILDRIPHSDSEKIKVEIEVMEPEKSKLELGVLKWRFMMDGIKEKVIHYKYHVEYKSGITITPSLP